MDLMEKVRQLLLMIKEEGLETIIIFTAEPFITYVNAYQFAKT
jgi:hypothetical protein